MAPRWTDRYPSLGSGPLDVSTLLEPGLWELERDRIFRRRWLPLARQEEVARAGQYVCRPVEPASTEVVVVRGRDGVLRAFHNICAHRGNSLVARGCGRKDRFVCPFHAWSYRLDGSLAAVTDADQFPPFDAHRRGLVPVEVDEWQGFVFVRLDADGGPGLAEYLGACGARLERYPLRDMPRAASFQADLAVNWKVALDAFQEGYHVPFLHRRSAGRAYADGDNPCIHALHFELFEHHRMASYPGVMPTSATPLEKMAAAFGASVTRRADMTRADLGLNPTGSTAWAFDMFVFFPAFFVFAFDGFFFTYTFWPSAVDRTRFELGVHFPPTTTVGERFAQELAISGLRDTLLEDLEPMESVQRNLASGVRGEFILQDQELLIRHSHHVIRRESSAARAP